MPTKNQITVIGVLSVLALGLGYWYGLPDKPVTNIVVANPQPTPTTPNPLKIVPNGPTGAAAIDAAIRTELKAAGSIEKVRHIDLTRKMITNVSALARLKQLEILWLPFNNLTDISALEELTQLERLSLENNPNLTIAQIEQLQRALPNCKIFHNATK